MWIQKQKQKSVPIEPNQFNTLLLLCLTLWIETCAHHAILTISWRHGEQIEGGVQRRTMPSLLCLLFYVALFHHACLFLFASIHCFCLRVYTYLTSRATDTRRDAPYKDMPTQWGMATQEEMATQDETAEWRLNSEWPSQLSTPKLSPWRHDPYAIFRTLCWFSISRLLHSLVLSKKLHWFPLSSHRTAHPLCGHLINST